MFRGPKRGDAGRGYCAAGARGNVTLFPLPLDDIYAAMREGGQQIQLPHTPASLLNVVRVILKTAPTDAARVIAQAQVRRSVVIALIEDRIDRQHPGYRHLSKTEVRERARALPENGPLQELVYRTGHDDALDKIQPLKQNTPVHAPRPLEQTFAGVRSSTIYPRSVTRRVRLFCIQKGSEIPPQNC